MKILLVGSNRSMAIERHYVRHLTSLGAEAVDYAAPDIVYDFLTANIINKILFKIGIKTKYPEVNKGLLELADKIKPDVIVSYPVHGISGFQDHLVMHGVIKSVFCRLRTEQKFLKRLAFITVTKEDSEVSEFFKLSFSTESEIDCVIETEDSDIQKAIDSLDCYVTFSETIEKSNIKNFIKHKVNFEIFQEDHYLFDPIYLNTYILIYLKFHGSFRLFEYVCNNWLSLISISLLIFHIIICWNYFLFGIFLERLISLWSIFKYLFLI